MIVRLVLDPDGALFYGEIVDSAHAVRGRFAEWAELEPALRRLVEVGERGSNAQTTTIMKGAEGADGDREA